MGEVWLILSLPLQRYKKLEGDSLGYEQSSFSVLITGEVLGQQI